MPSLRQKHQSVEEFLGTLEASSSIEVAECEREPIHRPGKVLPHGLMLVLSEPDLTIHWTSDNAPGLVGVAPEDLLDRPLSDFVDAACIASIRGCLDRDFEDLNPLTIGFGHKTGDQNPDRASHHFDGIVHRAPSGEIILELDPHDTAPHSSFFQFHRQVKGVLSRIQAARDLQGLCDRIVTEVAALTQFDRVMVYRFGEDGSGHVFAEVTSPGLEPYLGLHYPLTDVPRQARYLYAWNGSRLIPDVNGTPARLVAAPSIAADVSPSTIDMSTSILRAVSPCHIEYLQNMGVSAAMSISLVKEGELWGKIACHHYAPKFVPYETRTICEFLGQLLSPEIVKQEESENLDYRLHLHEVRGQLVESLAGATDFSAELSAEPDRVLQLVGATGAAIYDGNRVSRFGQTPDEADLEELRLWLLDRFEGDLFRTHCLPRLYPAASEYAEIASGLLAVAISSVHNRYILWFRSETLKTVTWAGKPDTHEQLTAARGNKMRPRKSFEAWKETVCGTSDPWLRDEVVGAIELRQAIVDIVLHQADVLGKLNQDLERSNAELDSFVYIASHDLKEPLRGIHNYATFLLEDYGEVLDAEGQEKLETLVQLSSRMEGLIAALLKFSHLENLELQMQEIDLNALIAEIAHLFRMSPRWENTEIRIPEPLPTVWGERSLIEEIFVNLISNAFKYNRNDLRWVEIGICDDEKKDILAEGTYDLFSNRDLVSLFVRDNGIGIRQKHLDSVFRIFKRLHAQTKYGGGSGAGLTIVRKIIERHGGTIRATSTYGQGTTFLFALPARNSIPNSPLAALDDDHA